MALALILQRLDIQALTFDEQSGQGRGESLAALVARCERVLILSKVASKETWCKCFERGIAVRCEPSGSPRGGVGTTLRVEGFLACRKGPSELRRRLDRMALLRPQLALRLRTGPREVEIIDLKQEDVMSRMQRVLGLSCARALCRVQLSSSRSACSLEGVISRLKDGHASDQFMFLYINGRFVEETPIHTSIANFYATSSFSKVQSGRGPQSIAAAAAGNLRPLFVLNLMCPVEWYDLNFLPDRSVAQFRDWKQPIYFILNCLRRVWFERNAEPDHSPASLKRSRLSRPNFHAAMADVLQLPVACLCKKVRFLAPLERHREWLSCHCFGCRRAHGAAWVPLVPLATKGLEIHGERGSLKEGPFSMCSGLAGTVNAEVKRHFCQSCGSICLVSLHLEGTDAALDAASTVGDRSLKSTVTGHRNSVASTIWAFVWDGEHPITSTTPNFGILSLRSLPLQDPASSERDATLPLLYVPSNECCEMQFACFWERPKPCEDCNSGSCMPSCLEKYLQGFTQFRRSSAATLMLMDGGSPPQDGTLMWQSFNSKEKDRRTVVLVIFLICQELLEAGGAKQFRQKKGDDIQAATDAMLLISDASQKVLNCWAVEGRFWYVNLWHPGLGLRSSTMCIPWCCSQAELESDLTGRFFNTLSGTDEQMQNITSMDGEWGKSEIFGVDIFWKHEGVGSRRTSPSCSKGSRGPL
eukprot:g8541.t1